MDQPPPRTTPYVITYFFSAYVGRLVSGPPSWIGYGQSSKIFLACFCATYTAVSRVVMTWGVLSVGLTSSRVVQLRIGLLGAGHGAAYRRDAHVCYKQCFGLMKTIQSSGIRQFSRLSANLS